MKERRGHAVYCEVCKTDHYIEDRDIIVCDTCGKEISPYRQMDTPPPIYLVYNYTDYDFCNLKCMFKFILEELKKENPRNDIEFGQEGDTQKGEEKK